MTEWFSREDDSISGLCSPLGACLHNKGLTCIYGCHSEPCWDILLPNSK